MQEEEKLREVTSNFIYSVLMQDQFDCKIPKHGNPVWFLFLSWSSKWVRVFQQVIEVYIQKTSQDFWKINEEKYLSEFDP